jgi:hypothetical protein
MRHRCGDIPPSLHNVHEITRHERMFTHELPKTFRRTPRPKLPGKDCESQIKFADREFARLQNKPASLVD